MVNIFRKLFTGNAAVDFRGLKEKGAIILDVRSPSEFNSGHFHQSINVPLDKIGIQMNTIKKMNKPVITVCRSGSRSSMATELLNKAGIEAYNGGAWNRLAEKLV